MLAAALASGGCSSAGEESAADAAVAGAEFRQAARDVYEAVSRESCVADPALRRAVVLARERQAVGAFEERMRATPLRFHLDAARSDVRYALAADGGCWEDSDPRFARLHVQMARERAAAGLRRMEALAPALAASLPTTRVSAAAGAEFRHFAREAAEALQAPCAPSSSAADEILAPARAEVQRFRTRLEGTDHAVHFAVAEADTAYLHSITIVDCDPEPDPLPTTEARRQALERVRRRIAELEARL